MGVVVAAPSPRPRRDEGGISHDRALRSWEIFPANTLAWARRRRFRPLLDERGEVLEDGKVRALSSAYWEVTLAKPDEGLVLLVEFWKPIREEREFSFRLNSIKLFFQWERTKFTPEWGWDLWKKKKPWAGQLPGRHGHSGHWENGRVCGFVNEVSSPTSALGELDDLLARCRRRGRFCAPWLPEHDASGRRVLSTILLVRPWEYPPGLPLFMNPEQWRDLQRVAYRRFAGLPEDVKESLGGEGGLEWLADR